MTTMTMSTMVMMMAATWCCQCKHGHVLITMFFFMITCSLNKIITCTDSRALHCYHSYNFKTYSKYILFLNIVAIYNTGAFENDSLEGTYNMYLYCSFFKIREKSNQNEKKKTMVAYFCHHLSDNYVDLSDVYVDLSDLYVDLSDLYVDLSLIPSVEK